MAYIQEKSKGKKIISFKFKTYLDRDENGKQIVKCMTWYPPSDLTPAKARKEAQLVAARWEDDLRVNYSRPPVPLPTSASVSFTFSHFVNEIWLPLCVRDGSHRPTTIAMYSNILKIILPHFQDIPIDEITGIQISQYLYWLRND